MVEVIEKSAKSSKSGAQVNPPKKTSVRQAICLS